MSDNDNNNTGIHTSVSGAINQHTPSYWRLVIPALGARYVGRYIQKFNNADSRVFDAAAGLWMLGTTGVFALRTAQDMKNIFSEAVAYEFDKKPSDINFADIMKSDNKAVVQTRNNYAFYNTLRTLVNSTFFVSLLPGKKFQRFREVESVDLGVGANGVYLMTEVLGRGKTFFEQAQGFVDSKIDQKNSLGEHIGAQDLIQLYERYALDNDKANAFSTQTSRDMLEQSRPIFERMAELMNQTYQPKKNGEKANFALPKFIYMIGHDLIRPRDVEKTLAYVEVANRYGMGALKQVAKAVEDGVALSDALQQYPVNTAQTVLVTGADLPGKKFTESLSPAVVNSAQMMAEGRDKTFVDRFMDQSASAAKTVSLPE